MRYHVLLGAPINVICNFDLGNLVTGMHLFNV